MSHITIKSIIFFSLLFSFSLQADENDSWPQWRGPNRDASVDSKSWKSSLDDVNLQRVWRAKLGPSYSSPLVVNDRVFVTETRNKKDEVVTAFNRTTGEKIWEQAWPGSMKVPFFAARNGSWIRSTPVYSDGKIYIGGIKDHFVCLDAASGSQLWDLDFMAKFNSPAPNFGCASSPLIDGDGLYVQAGGAFYKLNKNDGQVIWKTASDGGGMMGSAFSSPFIAELAGKRQVLVQSRTNLMGIDMENGNVLWSQAIPSFRGMNIVTPTVYKNFVFTSAYKNKSHLFEISQTGGKFSAQERWTNSKPAYMSSPIIIDGHIYMHLQSGRFTCVNLDTGKTKWTSSPQGEYASLVAGKERFLALRSDGQLMMIKANPEKFEVISTKKLSKEETWAHLAVCGSDVVVRELNGVALYQWQDEKSAGQ